MDLENKFLDNFQHNIHILVEIYLELVIDGIL